VATPSWRGRCSCTLIHRSINQRKMEVFSTRWPIRSCVLLACEFSLMYVFMCSTSLVMKSFRYVHYDLLYTEVDMMLLYEINPGSIDEKLYRSRSNFTILLKNIYKCIWIPKQLFVNSFKWWLIFIRWRGHPSPTNLFIMWWTNWINI
jgi:hypothetical protein